MLSVVCFLLFILYNFIMYSYSSNVFTSHIKNKKIVYISLIFNAIIFGAILLLKIVIPEALFMIIFWVVIFIEMKFIFNDTWLKNLFGSFCFAINFFSSKLILVSIYSLIFNIPLFYIVKDFRFIVMSLSIVFILKLISITLFRKIFPIKYIHMIITDKNNIKFCVLIVGSVYIYLTINTYLLYIHDYFNLVNVLNIKIGICATIAFFASILYGYIFSKLQLYVIKAESIEKEIMEDKLIIEKLKSEVMYDSFTSCFKRDFIEEELDKLLKEKVAFCVVFIDIDGLKITNDTYGHDEGDFYIKAVSNILNSEFKGNLIGRMGGDEFLIILKNIDIYTTMKYIVRCYEMVENIHKLYKKPYQTSISYGVVEVTLNNKLSKKEIIDLADSYMYNFKKSRKKNRK